MPIGVVFVFFFVIKTGYIQFRKIKMLLLFLISMKVVKYEENPRSGRKLEPERNIYIYLHEEVQPHCET